MLTSVSVSPLLHHTGANDMNLNQEKADLLVKLKIARARMADAELKLCAAKNWEQDILADLEMIEQDIMHQNRDATVAHYEDMAEQAGY